RSLRPRCPHPRVQPTTLPRRHDRGRALGPYGISISSSSGATASIRVCASILAWVWFTVDVSNLAASRPAIGRRHRYPIALDRTLTNCLRDRLRAVTRMQLVLDVADERLDRL